MTAQILDFQHAGNVRCFKALLEKQLPYEAQAMRRLQVAIDHLNGLYKDQDFCRRLQAEKRWNPKYGNGAVLGNQMRRNDRRIAETRARIEELRHELRGGASHAS